MGRYTVQIGAKSYDVDADNPQAAALAAHQVAGAAPKPASQQAGGRIPVLSDVADIVVGAAKQLGADVAKEYSRKPAAPKSLADFGDQVMGPPRMLGDLANLALSPINGAVQGAIVNPLAAGAAKVLPFTNEQTNRNIINTALMGARPGPLPHGPPLPPIARAAVASPVRQASRYVAQVARSAGATPDTLAAAAGPRPLLAAEAMGKSGQVALGALARRAGQTGDALSATIGERQATRGARMQHDFAGAVGISPEAASGDLQALVDAGRAKAAPLYEQAYSVGAVDTPELRTLTSRPSMQKAMSRAYRIAAEEGRDPSELGFEVQSRAGNEMRPVSWTEREAVPGGGSRDVVKTAMMPHATSTDEMVQLSNPTAQTWDYVKRGIDDVLNGYRDKVTGRLQLDEEGRAVLGTSKALRQHLVSANPAYGEALSVSGDYLSAEQAFKDGGKFVFNAQIPERQLADRLAKMSDSEREAFKGGIANRIFDLSQNGKLDPKVLSTPRVQAKLRMALGDEAAQNLIGAASDEGKMLGFERRYGPAANSVTAEMGDAMAEQDAKGALGQIAGDFVGNLHRGPLGAVSSALGNQVRNVGAALRTPGMSIGARDEAGKLLMMSPDELAAFLRERAAARPPLRLPSPQKIVGAAQVAAPLQRRDSGR